MDQCTLKTLLLEEALHTGERKTDKWSHDNLNGLELFGCNYSQMYHQKCMMCEWIKILVTHMGNEILAFSINSSLSLSIP